MMISMTFLTLCFCLFIAFSSATFATADAGNDDRTRGQQLLPTGTYGESILVSMEKVEQNTSKTYVGRRAESELQSFDIELRIRPGNQEATKDLDCSTDFEDSLTRDIDLLLLNITSDEDGNVCKDKGRPPFPLAIIGIGPGRPVGYRRTVTGSCIGCRGDDDDRRMILSITTTITPEEKIRNEVETAIQAIVLKYPICLGADPSIDIFVNPIKSSEVNKLECKTVLPFLETMQHGATPLNGGDETNNTGLPPLKLCGACIKLDFQTKSDGTAFSKEQSFLKKREYWDGDSIGVKVFATYGNATKHPNRKRVRIFDTSDPGRSYPQLGSPNWDCKGGGPGVGVGGERASVGANCESEIGNVLIIQEPAISDAKPKSDGGDITFKFDEPVLISDIGLMNIQGEGQALTFKKKGRRGSIDTYGFAGFGENSVQRVIANKVDVKKLTVSLIGEGAITDLTFCPIC